MSHISKGILSLMRVVLGVEDKIKSSNMLEEVVESSFYLLILTPLTKF